MLCIFLLSKLFSNQIKNLLFTLAIFLFVFHLNLFIISVFEKALERGLSSAFSLSKCNLLSHTTNHEIKAVISSRTAINTALQYGCSSFLTGMAITTCAHIATAAHWFGHKSSTAINDRHPAGPTLQPVHQSSQTTHILPLSLPPIFD
jgi:hypothetical protein